MDEARCRMKELRQGRNMTQQKLEQALYLTQQAIYQYEAGRNTINIELLCKLADFFGVTTDFLLGRE